jgi:flagellar hook-associated protein 2
MSTAAPTISFSGLASGLDTSSIITQLTTTAQLPITQLNTQITGYNSQLTDWQTLNTNLASLQTAVTTLSNQSSYNVPTASSTNTAAATITTQIGATLGSHALTVSQLAQAQEVVSASESSATTALGQSGSFTINGKTVQINTSDALSDVASKINAAGAGVNAAVVNVGTNDYRLTVTSTQTGAVNSIAAADSGGTVLSSLGLINAGAAGIRQGVSYAQGGTAYTGAASLTLSSATQPIGTLLGIASGQAQSGTFHLSNGATGAGNEADIAINLNTDSLTSIANSINKAGISGVSAEVVTVPDTNGNLNRIQQLRIVSSQSVPAVSSTATATGPGLSSSSTFGGSLTVNGQPVTLSGNSNSISQVQAAIQATTGNSGITATLNGSNLVLTDPAGNPITASLTSLHSFSGSSDNGALSNPTIANGTPAQPIQPAFTDTSGALATVGILQNSYTQTVTAAQDAKFNIDGLDLTRSTNTINDVISGATIGLLSGTAAAPATTTLNVTQNTASVVQAVSTFTAAYNAVQDFVTNENKFTPPTTTSGGAQGVNPALFGNTTLTQIQQTLSQALTAVSGTNTLQSLGITLNGTNDLTVDSNALTTALQADPNAVSNLFGLSGTSDSSGIQFIKGSAKSAASSGTGYDVVITQPAAQATGTAGTASTSGAVSTAPETLTFGGVLFPDTQNLTIPQGSTIQQTAALINATSSLNTQIYASVDSSNHLVISSQNYGTNTNFTVSSNAVASGTNSGIGPALTIAQGTDVAGTINGEAATGTGRTLTGNTGDAHAEGIQLLVTATAASPAGGVTGHVTLTHGVADGLNAALTQLLDPTNGSVIGAENGINSQIASAQTQITQIQTTVTNYTAYLTQLFSDMETRVSALQAQGSAFTAAFGGASSSSSSTASTTKSA